MLDSGCKTKQKLLASTKRMEKRKKIEIKAHHSITRLNLSNEQKWLNGKDSHKAYRRIIKKEKKILKKLKSNYFIILLIYVII